ncbi:MAG: S1-like domain-containing RNA-binding protein [Cytophagales bacterium]|nr:S1-like domain-containing RNA-binding protein [Cytophagales bacterium]
MKIGQINRLTVSGETPHGIYLTDREGERVLLPGKYLNGTEKEGDEIEVFVYNDSEDRKVATTEKPKIRLDEFAVLKAVDVTKYGVFLDWGLEKDLLVPFKEQYKKMVSGEYYVVRMYLDEDTERLVATAKVRQFLSNEDLSIREKEQVDLIVFNQSELGFDVIINEKHHGLIYKNEVFTSIKAGDRLTGYIKRIREDKKIDVSLRQEAFPEVLNSSKIILEALERNGGALPLSDRSVPEEIYNHLGMSKKNFKKAIGYLYRQRKIVIESDGIRLVS